MIRRSPAFPPQYVWIATLRCGATLALLTLSGCSGVEQWYGSQLPFDTPIDWWHQLQGGIIADERPPPPGVGDAYPNLGEIPAKPTPPDAATRTALSARLAAERDRADRAAARDPIGTASAPTLASNLPASTAAAPANSTPPMARIDAAQAPPPSPSPPTPPAPPAPAALRAAASPTPPPRQPGQQFVEGPVPPLPTTPPARAAIEGIPSAPDAPIPPKLPLQVDAAFVAGSAILRPESTAALQQLASQRFGGTVAVLGGGDASSPSPDNQAAALPLAWRRAVAMQDVLKASGVPPSAMHVDAAALARGGTARLID